MTLDELLKDVTKHERRKRVGRGRGSGSGKTCGRGHKGYRSRAGSGGRGLNEGGQMPLFRRIPKRGFNNKWRKEYSIINVADLNRFEDGDVVTPGRLVELGVVRKKRAGIKVLGNGKLQRKLTVSAHKFSAAAVEKISAAGGTTKVLTS